MPSNIPLEQKKKQYENTINPRTYIVQQSYFHIKKEDEKYENHKVKSSPYNHI